MFGAQLMRDAYIADAFAGQGGVARALRRLGFQARTWEITHGEHGDLTSARVLRALLSDVRRGRRLGAMIAP
eukprot:7335963-Pyramimonas_sp.AAC.1